MTSERKDSTGICTCRVNHEGEATMDSGCDYHERKESTTKGTTMGTSTVCASCRVDEGECPDCGTVWTRVEEQRFGTRPTTIVPTPDGRPWGGPAAMATAAIATAAEQARRSGDAWDTGVLKAALLEAMRLPDSGGTIGLLPDGTVIEVRVASEAPDA